MAALCRHQACEGGPEQVTTAETMSRGAGGGRPPRRVVLLSESMGLAALVKHLLGASGTLTRFATLREAADRDGLDDADTVVLDLPREGPDTALAQVRHRYRGELVCSPTAARAGPRPWPTWPGRGRCWSGRSRPSTWGRPSASPAWTRPPPWGPRPSRSPSPRPTGTRRSRSGRPARSRPPWPAPPPPPRPRSRRRPGGPRPGPRSGSPPAPRPGWPSGPPGCWPPSPRAGRPGGGCASPASRSSP